MQWHIILYVPHRQRFVSALLCMLPSAWACSLTIRPKDPKAVCVFGSTSCRGGQRTAGDIPADGMLGTQSCSFHEALVSAWFCTYTSHSLTMSGNSLFRQPATTWHRPYTSHISRAILSRYPCCKVWETSWSSRLGYFGIINVTKGTCLNMAMKTWRWVLVAFTVACKYMSQEGDRQWVMWFTCCWSDAWCVHTQLISTWMMALCIHAVWPTLSHPAKLLINVQTA